MYTPINSWPRPPRSVRARVAPIALSSLLLLLLTAIGTHPMLARANSTSCQSFTVPVALEEGQALNYSIYGELCNPASGASTTVQLLVAGATYGHIFGLQPLHRGRTSTSRHKQADREGQPRPLRRGRAR